MVGAGGRITAADQQTNTCRVGSNCRHTSSAKRPDDVFAGRRAVPMSSDAYLGSDPTLATPRSLPDHNPGRGGSSRRKYGWPPGYEPVPATGAQPRKLDARPFDQKIRALSASFATLPLQDRSVRAWISEPGGVRITSGIARLVCDW
jgi:hypothetical protein